MAKTGYAAFRDAALEGTDPDGRDHPTKRARAARDYLAQADKAAQAAVEGAERSVEKATDQLDVAGRNLEQAKRDRAAAARELSHAKELVKDVESEYGDGPDGPDRYTDADAAAAEGQGK